jgi:putative transposase
MSTYTQILYQIVFCSKGHIDFLTAENQNILYAYIVGILNKRNCHPYKVGGYLNHIHILTHLLPAMALSDLVRDIKRASHEMMINDRVMFRDFPGWQVGYGAFTYNISLKDVLIQYILNQEQHHSGRTYLDEFVLLLKENKIQYREEYLLT